MVELLEKDIKSMIYTIRGQQVMLDSDLAMLYGYETRTLNQQVKRNLERFPEDFMFQLTTEEIDNVKSQNVTSRKGYFVGQDGGTRKLPFVFTEEGIYMLSTVLKGELAVKQSIMIMRVFKEMRHYINDNKHLLTSSEYTMLSKRIDDNKVEIENINNRLDIVMDNFIDESKVKEFVFVDGQKFEADEAYISIYKQAKKSIYIVDDYVSIKTLSHLKTINEGVEVILFSDNKAGRDKLSIIELQDFKQQYFNIELRETNNQIHDRLIVLDYKLPSEKIYLCGASSKDAGNKFCTILEVHYKENYHGVIDKLKMNNTLVL